MAHGAADTATWSDEAGVLADRLGSGTDGLTAIAAEARLAEVGPPTASIPSGSRRRSVGMSARFGAS